MMADLRAVTHVDAECSAFDHVLVILALVALQGAFVAWELLRCWWRRRREKPRLAALPQCRTVRMRRGER